MKIGSSIPLLFIILVIYNVIALIFGAQTQEMLNRVIISHTMNTGALFALNVNDLLIISGIFLLYFEIFKSTSSLNATIFDHVLSLLVFLAFLLEFIFVAHLTCAAFLIVGMMSLLDVVAGLTVSITAARRDFGIEKK